VISGSGGLTKIGAGTLTLDNANTYTGATTVNAGTLALSFLLPPGFGLGTTGSIAASSGLNLAASGATFDISVAQANQTIKDLTGVAGSSIVLGGSTLTAGTANSTSFAGVISGSGGFTKAGTGTLTLSGANTYSGTTQINGGILSSNNSNVFSPNSVVSIAAGATLDLGTLFDQTIAGLSGAGSVNMGVAQLTVNQAGATTYSGVISGGSGSGSGLVKSGAGTLP
jgi:autotransporter-associated beta strand protein